MNTLKNIMTEAHKIAKTLEGNYTARLSYALKLVWDKIKAPKINIKELKEDICEACKKYQYVGNSMLIQRMDEKISNIGAKAYELGNEMIESICEMFYMKRKLSEKQAWCLAFFAKNNNVNLNGNGRVKF